VSLDSLSAPSMAQAAALATALDLTINAIDHPRTPEPGEGRCVACGRLVWVRGNRWCSESCFIAEDGPYDDPEPDEDDEEDELLREED
jgi:hypothetical protein